MKHILKFTVCIVYDESLLARNKVFLKAKQYYWKYIFHSFITFCIVGSEYILLLNVLLSLIEKVTRHRKVYISEL